MSQRTQRVASVLRDALQAILTKGLQDPRVRGLITVVKVTVADDLTEATVHVSVMPAEHAELTMHGLRAASAHIRRQIGNATSLSRVPTIGFRLDTSSLKQAGVLEAIAKVAREREAKEAEAQVETDPPEEALGDER